VALYFWSENNHHFYQNLKKNQMKNFTRTFLFITFFCYLPIFLQAADLKGRKTVPANQQKDVDPFLTEIIILFSAPIKMNSWSFVTTDQGEFPKKLDELYFPDSRTCILPILLEPDKAYNIGIDSPTRRGFKIASDETVTCIPYILTFRTAGSGEDVEVLSEKLALSKKLTPSSATQIYSASKPVSSFHNTRSTLILHRVSEKKENTFSILLPDGWQTVGGIFRIDPTV
jgi:hypothetical protein